MQELMSHVNVVYSAAETIAGLYQAYINDHTDDYDVFDGSTAVGGVTLSFRIALSDTEYELLANVGTVAVELHAYPETERYTGRVEISASNALKFEVGPDSLKIGLNIAGMARTMLEFVRQEGAVTGYLYEHGENVVKRLLERGDYLGSHSYGHLQYIDVKRPDTTLVSRDEFTADLRKSYEAMGRYGITPEKARYFLPPFEEYNATVASWANMLGLTVVNYTPGTGSAMDYTTPDLPYYRSSEEIYRHIMDEEEKNGLNGHILLLHLGTDPARTDKFFDNCLDRLIADLLGKGYRFVLLEEAIGR